MAGEMNSDEKRPAKGASYGRYTGVGFTFVFTLGVCAAAGFGLDSFLGTLPLFLLAGIAFGFSGGLYYLYTMLKRLEGG